MTKLLVNNISKSFDQNKVIENISLCVNENEIVGILGISGSGKSTLFNIISGILKPDTGNIILNGKDITYKTGFISYMLQKDLLLPHKTIEDNIALPFTIKGVKKELARNKVNSYFKQFGLEGTEKLYPHQLSGGMKQRASFLRTYMLSNSVSLLDEPFGSLDAITKTALQNWYLNITNEIKSTTLFITHDIDEGVFLSDRIYIITDKPSVIKKEIIINRENIQKKDFNLSPKFLEYKKEILDVLESIH